MDNKYIKDAYSGIKTSDDVMIEKVRTGLNGSDALSKGIRIGKRFSRKFAAVAAAMVMVLAFGAVAYANGWFDLGVIDSRYDSYEMIAVEDTDQYKAAKEVMDYYNSLPDRDPKATWELEDGGTLNEAENTLVFVEPQEKVKEVLKKYDLEYERQHYYVDSAAIAFDKAGVNNFLGKFRDIDTVSSKSTDKYIACDIAYTDKGSVIIRGGTSYSADPVSWELSCIPSNVYIPPVHAFASDYDKEQPGYEEWNFETDDGYHAKVASYKSTASAMLVDGREGEWEYRTFKCLVPLETYTIEFNYQIRLEYDTDDITKTEFERIVDQFDLLLLVKAKY